ncbi:MAG: Asp-tRNA(Asn)/Glu-tRNA(Gln) amidotransferase subunit GatA [Euzebya tangerina]|nr:Asp-tRNA(Asn)/Glu-tRNA(Gln) amidotransferase subunit GatA [Euzebya tangerina]
MSLVTKTAAQLTQAMAVGDTSAVEVTQAHLDRIAATDERLGAWLEMTAEQALADAEAIDTSRAAGESVGPLAGIPVAIKDLMCLTGVATTAGSKILEGFRPPYDATVVSKVKQAGGIILGKTNMDEFAMGSSTENSAWGDTHNPWDLGRIPGGSSGGSAAAVAGFHSPLSLGTDTGGSIRQPASVTGTVGIKPTYGRASRYGLIAFASSLDQAGTFGRTVHDAAVGLQAICGHDPLDSTSIPEPMTSYTEGLDAGVEGLRVGIVTEWMGTGGGAEADPGVMTAVRHAIDRLAALGAEIVEVTLPHASYGLPAYYLIAPSEASANLSRYDGVRYGLRVDGATTHEMMAATRAAGFGAEVKRRIMIGTYALSAGYFDAYYGQAQKVRTLIIRDFAAAFDQADVLVGPTCPTVAFPLGDKTADPLAMYLNDIYAVPASLAGMPAMSLPVGFDDGAPEAEGRDGLPVGLQLIGPLLGEPVMLQTAAALEADLDLDLTPRGANALEAPTA